MPCDSSSLCCLHQEVMIKTALVVALPHTLNMRVRWIVVCVVVAEGSRQTQVFTCKILFLRVKLCFGVIFNGKVFTNQPTGPFAPSCDESGLPPSVIPRLLARSYSSSRTYS